MSLLACTSGRPFVRQCASLSVHTSEDIDTLGHLRTLSLVCERRYSLTKELLAVQFHLYHLLAIAVAIFDPQDIRCFVALLTWYGRYELTIRTQQWRLCLLFTQFHKAKTLQRRRRRRQRSVLHPAMAISTTRRRCASWNYHPGTLTSRTNR